MQSTSEQQKKNLPSTDKKTPRELRGVKGMSDVLPQDAFLWEYLEQTAKDTLHAYGYKNIRTPILETTQLFTRGIGEVTDIVEKEMYSFTDSLNGEQLTLRPENTAAVVRAVLEHNLLYEGPKRLWYSGPMFRHERPQRGRYRQFHQIGVEALGFHGPDIDAEVILMCQRFFDELGLTGIELQINSLGQAEERAAHRKELVVYLEKNAADLDEDARRRLYTNPLRILDSKNPAFQQVIAEAPKLINYLGTDSLRHFEALQSLLKAHNIVYKINHRLVRGLDYYNLSVFEWVTTRLGAQGTLAGGGRYDLLVQQLGGKSVPACGWALGVERVLELLKEDDLVPPAESCQIYVAYHSDAAMVQAMVIAERLRQIGLDVIYHCMVNPAGDSLKSQIKRADSSGASYAVIMGESEISSGTATVKYLRAQNIENNQQSVPLEKLEDYLMKHMTQSLIATDASI